MKYLLIQDGQYRGEISYEPNMTSKERSIPGCEIWYMSDDYKLPKNEEYEHMIQDPRPFPNEDALQAIRNKRDVLIAETDWVVLSDVSLTEEKKQALLSYRQALRDLPETFKDNPNDVIWPTKP